MEPRKIAIAIPHVRPSGAFGTGKLGRKNSCSVRLTRLVRVIEQKDCEESFLVLCEGGDVEGQFDFTARRLWLQTAVTVRGRDLGNSAGGAEGVQVCLV